MPSLSSSFSVAIATVNNLIFNGLHALKGWINNEKVPQLWAFGEAIMFY